MTPAVQLTPCVRGIDVQITHAGVSVERRHCADLAALYALLAARDALDSLAALMRFIRPND